MKIHRKKAENFQGKKRRCFSQSLRWKKGMQRKIEIKHKIFSPRTEQVMLA